MTFIFHYPAVMMFPFFLLYLTICPELSPTVLPTFGHPLNPCIILYSVPFSTIVLPFGSPYNITWFSLQHPRFEDCESSTAICLLLLFLLLLLSHFPSSFSSPLTQLFSHWLFLFSHYYCLSNLFILIR